MDILLKGIPDSISEQEIKEWVAIKVERVLKAQLSIPKEDGDKCNLDVDAFRKGNLLEAKYEVTKEVADEPKRELGEV